MMQPKLLPHRNRITRTATCAVLALACASAGELGHREAISRLAEMTAEINKSTENIGARRLHTLLERLLEEIAFFAPDVRCALFPDWETLPYDTFSPHQDLISERLATLWRISQGDADVVVVPATTALYRLAPPSFLAGYTFHFQVKQ